MIAGLDSATPPGAAQVAQAKAAGVVLWNGYLVSSVPGPHGENPYGLGHAWTQAQFDIARQCGGIPIGYCSGWDDPAKCAALAKQWNVRLCLDVEGGIRGDGAWVQQWLDASGAGLYGNLTTHQKYRAPWRVLGAYVNADPDRTWQGPAPAEPHGWQWRNSHNEFGVTVDRCWFDDWFGGDDMPLAVDERKWLEAVYNEIAAKPNFRAGFDQIYDGLLEWQKAQGESLPQDVQDAIKVLATHLK